MTVTKSFSVEFDDSLLSYEGWKAPRFEGSKLIARHLNVYTPPALIGGTGKNIQFRGSNPPNSLDRRDLDQYFNAIGGMIIRTGSKLVAGRHINYSHVSASLNIRVNVDPFVEPTTQNRKNWGGDILGPKRDFFNFVVGHFGNFIPLGTNIKSAEDEDPRLVRIDGHSYAKIDRFLIINKEFNTTRILHIDDIHSSSLMPFIGNICSEGDNVNFRILDKNIKHNIKPRGYFVKSNIGEFMKIYGYEPPRTRLANGKYQTSSFFNQKSGDGVVIGFSKNPKENPPLNRFVGSHTARSSKRTHTFNVFTYGQTLTGSANTSSAGLQTTFNHPSMFFRSDINGSFNNSMSGSLTDMYSGSFFPPLDPKTGHPFPIHELRNVGVPFLGSTKFTSVVSASGGTSQFSGSMTFSGEGEFRFSTGFENVTQARNPLRPFMNDKVMTDLVSGSNRYFITAESGNFGVLNNKLESISTGELRVPGNGLSQVVAYRTTQERDQANSEGTIKGPSLGQLANTSVPKIHINENGQFDPYEDDTELVIGMSPRGIPSSLSGSDFLCADTIHSANPPKDQAGLGVIQANSTVVVNNGRGFFNNNGLSLSGLSSQPGGTLIISASFAYPYSGYQLSVLREEPTYILNLQKDEDLPNGLGTKGFAVLPQNLDPEIKSNLDYYFERAGLIEPGSAPKLKFNTKNS